MEKPKTQPSGTASGPAPGARTPAEPTEPDHLRLQPEKRDGWSISDCDPNDLLGVFKALRLKAEFALHAYEFRSGGNGNEDVFLDPPRPPGAIRLMQVIEGGGSPWSYLSASILGREAAEFGARWHGPVPHTWEPSYSAEGTTKRVVLHIRNPVGQDTIYRATDSYAAGSYVSETESTVVCTGAGGIIY